MCGKLNGVLDVNAGAGTGDPHRELLRPLPPHVERVPPGSYCIVEGKHAKIREGFELDSAELGFVAVDDIFEVVEARSGDALATRAARDRYAVTDAVR